MIISIELNHALVIELLYFIQLITCWNLLPQKGNRTKNLIFISSVFIVLLVIYNYVLFTKGFDTATNNVLLLLTIPGFILYFIISKYRDGRLVFSYFFSDLILFNFNFLSTVIIMQFFPEKTIGHIILRDIFMIAFALLFNLLYIPKIRKALDTTHVNWNIIAGISIVAGMYSYYELIGRGSILDRQDELISISISCILLIVVFLTLLWTIVKIGEKEQQEIELLKKENSLDLIRIQLKQVDATYKQINETYDKLRYIKHDFNKELAILEGLCIEGNITKIKNYISKIIKTIPDTQIINYSTNHMLNSILNHYHQLIIKENIESTFSINLNINDDSIISDICLILANGIENAIEATIKAQEKFINVEVYQKEKSVIISLTNTFEPNNIKMVDNKIVTTKKDVDNHGLGLKIIENIAKSYNGNMIHLIDENKFRLDIWLNI